MISTLIFDFSRVLLFPKKVTYKGDLNPLHKKLFNENPVYDFLDFFELNEELLSYCESIKDKYDLYIFTSGSIQNIREVKTKLNATFKKIFSAEEMRLSKKEPESYLKIVNGLGKKPQEVMFIDDSNINTRAAEQAGLSTHVYINNYDLVKNIKEL